MRGARWAHARDQMVTGASPTTSAGDGASGRVRCGCYGARQSERRGEDRQKLTVIVVGWTASSGDDRSKQGGRGDLGGRRLKTTTVKTKRSFPAHLAR